jgi:hypothetical protein
MKFEWESSKAAENETKHKVSFTEAIAVFQDSLSMTYPDADHSEYEDRFLLIGPTSSSKF